MMRDAERFKDKIELSLDSRQIFFLFFGGAVVASLVFVLGVMVGKRLELRAGVGQRAATSAAGAVASPPAATAAAPAPAAPRVEPKSGAEKRRRAEEVKGSPRFT